MSGLPAAEPHGQLYLGTVPYEFSHLSSLRFQIVTTDIRPETHFPKLGALLTFLGLPVFLGCQVTELSIVQQAANRRIGVGSNLYQINFGVLGHPNCLGNRHYSQLTSVVADNPHLG